MKCLILIVIFIKVVVGTKLSISICDDFEGAFAKYDTFLCCANSTHSELQDILRHPYQNGTFLECSKTARKDEDDIQTQMWKDHECALKVGGAFPGDKITYSKFKSFMINSYQPPLPLTSKSDDSCKPADAETTNYMKLEKFAHCFYVETKKVCHKPYYPKDKKHPQEYKTLEDYCKPSDKNSTISWSNGHHCCKGRYLPFELSTYLYQIDLSPDFDDLDNCSDSFVERQKALDPLIKKSEEGGAKEIDVSDGSAGDSVVKLAHRCDVACDYNAKPYKAKQKLLLNLEPVKDQLFNGLSKRMKREELILIEKNFKKTNVFISGNTTLSLPEFEKNIKEKDELNRIRVFCSIQTIISQLERVSAIEYCLGEEYADSWFDKKGVYMDQF